MYTVFVDKPIDFKCNIDVEGAKLSDTKVRLVLESANLNMIFFGSVDSAGKCNIPISKLKSYLAEGEEGTVKLEVIAEDTFFSPWQDDFTVKMDKKVVVEVQENESKKEAIQESKVSVAVEVESPEVEVEPPVIKETKSHGKTIAKVLSKHGVNRSNIVSNKEKINILIEAYRAKYKVSDTPKKLMLDIIQNL